VAFLFGLMHGFGFSNVLRELGLPKEGLVWALLNFNLGVEAGQAIAVVVAVPLLMWLRRFRWEPRAVAAVSALVLVVGLALFVDRAFLTSPDARAVMDVIPQSPLCLTSAQIAPRTRISVLPGPGLRGRRSPAPRSTGHSYSCRRPLSMRTKTTASEHRP
jgi:hypothetical protein